MRTYPLALLLALFAGCQAPQASTADNAGNLGGKTDDGSEDDWHKHIGSYAFEAPHSFEVIRTSAFDVKLMDVLGDQTVLVVRSDDNGNQVAVTAEVTHGGRARVQIPADTPRGTLDLSMRPWKLDEMGAITYWPQDGGGVTRIDYAWFDDKPDHAIVNFQGVAILEDGAVDLVLRSDTTGTELHRYHMAAPDYEWPAWQDPNGYITFNAPIESAGIARDGEVLSVHAVTKSGDAVLACARVEHDAANLWSHATLLGVCPASE
jgi:hypothetical protein